MPKEEGKVFHLLMDPRVSEFIDWRKLLSSKTFEDVLHEQISHFIKHGDHSCIKKTLELIGERKEFRAILLYACDSAGLDFSFADVGFVLRRSLTHRVIEGSFQDYVAKYSGTEKHVRRTMKQVSGQSISRKSDGMKGNTADRSIDESGIFSAYPKRLEDVPSEYRAAVYARNVQARKAKRDEKLAQDFKRLQSELKSLKDKLRRTKTESEKESIRREISALEKTIRKAPKIGRRWSPVLPGSFESGKKR